MRALSSPTPSAGWARLRSAIWIRLQTVRSSNTCRDLKHAVTMDFEATTSARQAEVGAARRMMDRTADQFEVTPSGLAADTGYGSAEMLGGWSTV
jgi:hypothetical protein